jgi:hypothetical protein
MTQRDRQNRTVLNYGNYSAISGKGKEALLRTRKGLARISLHWNLQKFPSVGASKSPDDRLHNPSEIKEKIIL